MPSRGRVCLAVAACADPIRVNPPWATHHPRIPGDRGGAPYVPRSVGNEGRLEAGQSVTVVWSDHRTVRRSAATVVGEVLDHVDVALDDTGPGSHTGTAVGGRVGMVWAGNVVTCDLIAREGSRFRLKPATALDVVDTRSVTRSPTSLDATWIDAGGQRWDAAVVDLSLRGAKVVVPAAAAPRDRGTLVFGSDRLPVDIRRMAVHLDLGVVEIGTQFLDLEAGVRRTLMRTVGSVRIGDHRWG
jgi:hypothetical protein